MKIFDAANNVDDQGFPAGGYVQGAGFRIDWQNGPLGRVGTAERKEPNGAFAEDVLEAVNQRLEFYQKAAGGRFACAENDEAIAGLNMALTALRERTLRRMDQGVEGTHEES